MGGFVEVILIVSYIAIPLLFVWFIVTCVKMWRNANASPKKDNSSFARDIPADASTRSKSDLELRYEEYLAANKAYFEALEQHAPELDKLKARRDTAYKMWKELQQKPVYIPGSEEP